MNGLRRYELLVPLLFNLPEHRAFFRQFKEQLKVRFDQLEIWITSHPLDVI